MSVTLTKLTKTGPVRTIEVLRLATPMMHIKVMEIMPAHEVREIRNNWEEMIILLLSNMEDTKLVRNPPNPAKRLIRTVELVLLFLKSTLQATEVADRAQAATKPIPAPK